MISMKKKGSAKQKHLQVRKELCLQAVKDWCKFVTDRGHPGTGGAGTSDIREKARKHLSAVGYRFWYVKKKNGRELRYIAPSKKVFYSLRSACQACIDGDEDGKSVASNSVLPSQEGTRLFPEKVTVNFSQEKQSLKSPGESSSTTGSSTESTRRGRKRSRSRSPDDSESENFEPVQTSQECEDSNLHVDPIAHIESISDSNRQTPICSEENKVISGLNILRYSKSIRGKKVLADLKNSRLSSVSNVKKNSPQRIRVKIGNILVSSLRRSRTAKTILSSLIDSNAVALGAKVHYRGKQNSGGVITRGGILCDCCSKVFNLTAYEDHVGSTNHRPAANILLEDGRSLMDCKNQMKRSDVAENVTGIKSPEENVDGKEDGSDDVCGVCHYWGELVLCDLCPHAFHAKCLGFERAPDGDWFCPSCRCGICGRAKLENPRIEANSTSIDHRVGNGFDDILICFQCERKFHIECLRNAGVDVNLEKDGSKENMFCSRKCEDICSGLRKIVGERIPVGEDKDENLTWTLLKSTENDTRLEAALALIHECFEPLSDPLTKRDIVEDVVFGRESKQSRLNFSGFYIVVLESGDVLVTVATVRVFGEKLTEVPLVATRTEYRKRGMCHVLMNELEKQMVELGVERLTLPSARSVLQTWITSFGFSETTAVEKLQFLRYNLLDFEGSFMCQKRLIGKTSEAKSSNFKGNSPTEVEEDCVEDYLLTEEELLSFFDG